MDVRGILALARVIASRTVFLAFRLYGKTMANSPFTTSKAQSERSENRIGALTMKSARKQIRPAAVSRPTLAELYAMGKSVREKCPRRSHAVWKAAGNRPDPLQLLEQDNQGRIPELIPIRYGRMLRTPFTFYRGAALNMAADLAATPVTGMRVQACGDCHLLNFGIYATPERRLVFDINDLDETLPAPWEWDVKRLAASTVLACRNNGFSQGDARDAVLACVRKYRERMAEYSDQPVLQVWYASIDIDKLTVKDKDAVRRARKEIAAARARNVLEHDFPKLAGGSGQAPAIKDNPPLIYHLSGKDEEDLVMRSREAYADYRKTLQDDRRVLLDRYEVKDLAIKVVGVGSVGTHCYVALLMASPQDPLFLQVKEARRSVLEAYAGKSIYPNHGQRVVNGYRLTQSASDIFLGWAKGWRGQHVYVRQLRDMKITAQTELFSPGFMVEYAEFCGWALARAHARSGAPAQISGYLGKSDVFDKAIATFATSYADQTERDHAILKKAARSGRVEVAMEQG
jgi:uncharacterized protein (DUF2252 family)